MAATAHRWLSTDHPNPSLLAYLFDQVLLAESQHLPILLSLARAAAATVRREYGAGRMPETLRRGRPVGESTQLVLDDVQPLDHPRSAVRPQIWS